jgi:MFS family permease
MAAAFTKNKTSLAFAALFAIESFCRSLNLAVLSLQANDIVRSAAKVSLISVCVSFAVLLTTLSLPVLFGFVRRRWAYTAGILGILIGALCLSTFSLPGQIAGAYFRNASASLLNVTLSLYIMDNIRKQQLVASESLRLTLSTISWMAGPALGVYLYEKIGPAGPQLLVCATALVLLALFWYFKLKDPQLLPPGTIGGRNPLHNIKRFLAQPRLRLAWIIAFGRSCYWSVFFIYGPLVLLGAGASKQFTGIVVSLSQAMLFAAFLYGRIAQRVGLRKLITTCLAAAAVFAIAAGLAGSHSPYITASFMLAGATATVGLDAVAGVPYLRAVRPRERQQLTPIYRTFVELSELLPAVIFALVLTLFPTPVVFGLLGCFLFIIAGIAWQYLPKSM